MQIRKGVVVVVAKPVGKHYRFAVLERTKNWNGWELVKGGIEEDESAEEAAVREVEEETGISAIEEVHPLNLENVWEYERGGDTIRAEYVGVLITVASDARIAVKHNRAEEHARGHFLNFRDAIDLLTHENQKELLQRAQNILLAQ